MKVVLDTNVLISGIFFSGAPSEIIKAWLDQRFQVYLTPEILEEYLRVIEDFSKATNRLSELEWNEILPEISEVLPDEKDGPDICRDPTDDKFIFCAMNSGARYLVSGDIDLKSIEMKFKFDIVSPRQFLDVLSKR